MSEMVTASLARHPDAAHSSARYCLAAVLLLVAVQVFGYAVFFNRGPGTGDSLLYVHTALDLREEPIIVGRYGLVYLLNLVMRLTAEPPLAATVLAGLLFVGCGALIALLAGRFAPGTPAPLIAVIVYVATPFVTLHSLSPQTDLLAILIMLLGACLFCWRDRRQGVWLTSAILGILGGILLRSRELVGLSFLAATGACLLFEPGARLSERARSLGTVTMGAAASWLLFMLADHFFLGNWHFSIDRATYQQVAGFNASSEYARENFTFAEALMYRISFPLSLIYLLGLWWREKRYRKTYAFLLAMAGTSLMFHGFSLARVNFGFVDRYMFSSLMMLLPGAAAMLNSWAPRAVSGVLRAPLTTTGILLMVLAVLAVGAVDQRAMFFLGSTYVVLAVAVVLRIGLNHRRALPLLIGVVFLGILQAAGISLMLRYKHGQRVQFWTEAVARARSEQKTLRFETAGGGSVDSLLHVYGTVLPSLSDAPASLYACDVECLPLTLSAEWKSQHVLDRRLDWVLLDQPVPRPKRPTK
jgi:4-amino-4-deoxy-L-arabinose transferase-like glycosyltransferase